MPNRRGTSDALSTATDCRLQAAEALLSHTKNITHPDHCLARVYQCFELMIAPHASIRCVCKYHVEVRDIVLLGGFGGSAFVDTLEEITNVTQCDMGPLGSRQIGF